MGKKIRMLRSEPGYVAGIHLKYFEEGVIYEVGLGVGGIDEALAKVFTTRNDKRGPAAEWVEDEPIVEELNEELEEEQEEEVEEKKMMDEAPQKQAMTRAPKNKEKEDKKPKRTKESEKKPEKKKEEKKGDFHDHPTAESVWTMMSADEFSKHVKKYIREFAGAPLHIKVKAKTKWERLCHPAPCPFD